MDKLTFKDKLFVKGCVLRTIKGMLEGIGIGAVSLLAVNYCKGRGMNDYVAGLIGGLAGLAVSIPGYLVDNEIEATNEEEKLEFLNEALEEYKKLN